MAFPKWNYKQGNELERLERVHTQIQAYNQKVQLESRKRSKRAREPEAEQRLLLPFIASLAHLTLLEGCTGPL